jgi:hypothetical protein
MQKQSQEDLLGGVGGVLLVIQKPEANSPHAGLKPSHQRDKGRTVGAFSGGLGGKLFIGAMNQVNGHIGCRQRQIRHKPTFYTVGTVGNKPDQTRKIVQVCLGGKGGPRKCVFWRKWVVWLKCGGFLRR